VASNANQVITPESFRELAALDPLLTPAGLAHELSGGLWRPALHHLILSADLVDLAMGRIPGLIVEMPPRHGKSELGSHWFPVWLMHWFPDWPVVLASYELEQAAGFGRKVRDTIFANQDRLYTRLRRDTWAAHRWLTTDGGGMVSAGIGGPITGKGLKIGIVDDPIKNDEEAQSNTMRDKVWNWFRWTFLTRIQPDPLDPEKMGGILVIMTRWHEDDLVGRIMNEPWGQTFRRLTMPAVAESGDRIGRKVGDPLWPAGGFTKGFLEVQRARLGEHAFNSLYQQHPGSPEGSIFKRDWWGGLTVTESMVRAA
jgi:hypothetical protein